MTEKVWEKGLTDAPGLGLFVRETGKDGARFGLEMFGRMANPKSTFHVGDQATGPEWLKEAHDAFAALPEFAGAQSMLARLPLHIAINNFATNTAPALRGYVKGRREGKPEPTQPSEPQTPAQAALEALLAAADEAINPPDFTTRDEGEQESLDAQQVAQALKQSADEANATLCALYGAGCDMSAGANDKQAQAAVEAVASAITRNAELQRILEMAGRWKTVARSMAKSVPRDGAGRVIGIEYGNDISRMLPDEAAFFRHPRLKAVWRSRYSQGSLAQDKLRIIEASVAGPLCVMLDLSKSMDYASRHVFAKAVCLAIIEVALSEGRPVMLIPFNSRARVPFIFERESDVLQMLEFAKIAPSGGTSFTSPWLAFKGHVAWRDWPDAPKADVVMITDGKADVTEAKAIRDQLREKYPVLSVYGFCFGQAHKNAMDGLLDEGIQVEEIAESAKDAMQMLVNATV